MNAFLSLFQSRKTMRVFFGSIVILGGLYFRWSSFTTPEAKNLAFGTAVALIAGLFGIDIHGIATEDAATKSGNPQVNVNSAVDNTTKPSDPAPTLVPATVATPKPMTPSFTPDQLPMLASALLNELAKQQTITAARLKQQQALADTLAPGKIAP